MFDFLSMAGNYGQRKVARNNYPDGFVSTALVTDSRDPYETAIRYNKWGNNVVIVQTYTTRESAEKGHAEYVKLYESGQLPDEKPIGVGTNVFAELLRAVK